MLIAQPVHKSLPIRSFVKDKQRFFANKTPATQHSYLFLASHHQRIEQEITHLRALLDNNLLEGLSLRQYAKYCCLMLSTHYGEKMYHDPGKKYYYEQLGRQLSTAKNIPADKPPAWQHILYGDLLELLSIPAHTSKLRGWIGAANVYRIALAFSNILVQESLLLLKEHQWLGTLKPEHVNKNLQGLANLLRPFSVLFFIARLLIDLGVMAKHLLFPNTQEQHFSFGYRLYYELKKNFTLLVNDTVWATINGLSNYAPLFGLSIPVVNIIILVGFLSDISLILLRMWSARQDYLDKKKQYLLEKKQTHSAEERLIIEQLFQELELSAKVSQATLNANLLAALFILVGFTTPIFLTATPVILMCYALTMMGIALYLSADAYGVYCEKEWRNLPAERAVAQNAFIRSMVMNTCIPLLIVGILAVSWPAALCALVLTLTYAYSTRFQTTPPTDTAEIEQSSSLQLTH